MELAPAAVRVALADPVLGARTSLRRIAEDVWSWEVVGEAEDGFAAVRVVRSSNADVLLVDAGIDGLGLQEVRDLLAGTGTLVVGLLSRPEQHASGSGTGILKSVPADALRDFVLRSLLDCGTGTRTQDLSA